MANTSARSAVSAAEISRTASAESAVGVESGAVRSMCANSLFIAEFLSGAAGCESVVSGYLDSLPHRARNGRPHLPGTETFFLERTAFSHQAFVCKDASIHACDTNTRRCPRSGAGSRPQLVQQLPGRLQAGTIETFGEPVIYRRQHVPRLAETVLRHPQPRQTDRGSQFPCECRLLPRHLDRLYQETLSPDRIRWLRRSQNIRLDTQQFGHAEQILIVLNQCDGFIDGIESFVSPSRHRETFRQRTAESRLQAVSMSAQCFQRTA